jgi:putative transposase
VKYAFVQQHSTHHSVSALCASVRVSRSGYYAWLQSERQPSARSQHDAVLLQAIQAVHQQHRGAYGALKTWKHLSAQGYEGGKHRVARLRQAAGIEAQRKRRFRVSTAHHKSAQASPDLLNRQFTAEAPNRVWVGDMTFVRTRQGWLHLALLLDVYSRRVVGWAMGDSPNAALHEAALTMAIEQRQPGVGLIHHTDRGMLYRTGSYRALLGKAGMCQSMSGRKSAYDNAMAESFFSNLKNEWVHHCDYATREQARSSIFDYIELFYNRHRIHQSLGYQTPAQFEESYFAL